MAAVERNVTLLELDKGTPTLNLCLLLYAYSLSDGSKFAEFGLIIEQPFAPLVNRCRIRIQL